MHKDYLFQMKILLIYPGWTEKCYSTFNPARFFSNTYSIYPPLNLAYLASVAESLGHEVRIHDGELNKTSLSNYISMVRVFQPELIGFTAYTPSFKLAEDIATQIKKISSAKIVIGGVHFSAMNSKKHSCFLPEPFDYGFVGKSLLSWKTFLIEGAVTDNMLYRNSSGNVIKVVGSKYNDEMISSILPTRHLLENNRYKRPTPTGIKNYTTIFASIGCPFKCIFCSNENQKVIHRNVDDVVKEMADIKSKYGTTHFIMLDDTLTISREKTKELCDKIISNKLNITFEGSTRANLVDEELIKLMSEAGLVMLGFGLENADNAIRDFIKKDVKTESYIEANRLANKYGILTQNSCIIGLPGETLDTIRKTLLFLREHRDIKQANISIATPYPGTELYEMAKKGEYGLELLTEDFTKYKRYGSAVMNVGNLKAEELVSIQEEAFGSIYIVPWRWGSTIKRSRYQGLFNDFYRIIKLIIKGKCRFLFNRYLREEIKDVI